VRNEKAKRFLMNMRRKPGVQLESYFPRADRSAVALLKRMLVRHACSRADDHTSRNVTQPTHGVPASLCDGVAHHQSPAQQHVTTQAFDPADRPTCQEALSDPYFHGLAQPQREPAAQPVSKLAFEFEKRKLHTTEVGTLGSQGCRWRTAALPWLTHMPLSWAKCDPISRECQCS
jgi:hypothetical protein